MKNKALKALIKAKANDVNIKDHSIDIIQKANARVTKPNVIEKQPSRLRFKPVFAFSLAIVTTLLLVFIWTPSFSDDPFVIEAYDQALMTASISMVYAYEAEVNQNMSYQSGIFVLEDGYLIDDEIDQLTPYITWMEHFFESDANFNIEKIDVAQSANLHHIRFYSKDSADQEITYELILFDLTSQNNHQLFIEGELIILDEVYPITLTFDRNQKDAFVMASLLEDTQTISITYQKLNGQTAYEMQLMDHETLIKKITLRKDHVNAYIDLNFEVGKNNGTFRFKVGDAQTLDVTYAIMRDQMSETGKMVIQMIPRLNLPTRYDIEIRPQGGNPYQRDTEQRPTPQPPARPVPPRGPRAT